MVGRRKRRERCSGVSFVAVEAAFDLLFDFGLHLACSFLRVADVGGGGNVGMPSDVKCWFVTDMVIECRVI